MRRLTRSTTAALIARYARARWTVRRTRDGVSDYSWTDVYSADGRAVMEVRYRPSWGRAEVWGL